MGRKHIITCSNCHRTRPHGGHGWCDTCADRWRSNGRPADGPPPARPRAENARGAFAAVAARAHARMQVRMENYAELAAAGLNRREAAERLGVSLRSIERYRDQLGLTEPRMPSRAPRGDAMPRNPEPDATREVDRIRRSPSTRRVGHDFANKRDLSGDLADLRPEHLDVAVANVAAFARDDAERDVFLDMLGLAGYAAGEHALDGAA